MPTPSPSDREAYKKGVNATYRRMDQLEARALRDGARSVDDLKNRLLVRLQDGEPLDVLSVESVLNPILNDLLFDWAEDLEFRHASMYQVDGLSLGFDLVDQVLRLLGVPGPARPSLRDMQRSPGRLTSSQGRSWIYKAVVASMRDIRQHVTDALVAGKSVDRALRSRELWDRVNRRADRAVRTWQAEAISRATERRLIDLSATIPNLKKQFLTGGGNPCPECRRFAARTFAVIGADTGPRVPLHPNCNCTYQAFILGVTPSVTTTPRSGEVEFEEDPE